MRYVELTVIHFLCIIVFLLLMPNLEESVEEARTQHTWLQVRHFRDDSQRASDQNEVPLKDAWGRDYRIIELPDGEVGILSLGPNGLTHETGPDADDIFTGMPTSPVDRFKHRRMFEWWRAVAVGFGVWVVLNTVWFRERNRGSIAKTNPP